MSHEKKEFYTWVGRFVVAVCSVACTCMLAFLIWALDARTAQIGDARYVTKETYSRDQQRIEGRLDKNESEILAVIKNRKPTKE